MTAIHLESPYADAKRSTIFETERRMGDLGIEIDAEKKKEIFERFEARLAQQNMGWDFQFEETVTRVDEQGIAYVVPKSDAIGWIDGLPAAEGTHSSGKGNSRINGRSKPHRATAQFQDPGDIKPISMQEGAFNFYVRIREAIERTGYIPGDLQADLCAQGWRHGKPVPMDKVQSWCTAFTEQVKRKYS